MELNTWYYTLSSIAQTLGAILGLSAVFVSIKLQDLTSKLDGYKKSAREVFDLMKHVDANYQLPTTTHQMLKKLDELEKEWDSRYSRYTDLAGGIASLIAVNENNPRINGRQYLGSIRVGIDYYLDQVRDIVKLARLPGISAVSIIIIIFLALGLTDFITIGNIIVFWYLIIFSVFATYSLARASWKILSSFR